jgi:hypothetical protein
MTQFQRFLGVHHSVDGATASQDTAPPLLLGYRVHGITSVMSFELKHHGKQTAHAESIRSEHG